MDKVAPKCACRVKTSPFRSCRRRYVTLNERVPVKLSVFMKGVHPLRRVIKDCLKFVACRTNFVYIDGTPCGKTRDNRCLLPLDKSVPWTDSEFAITINSSVHVILFVSYITTVLHLKYYIYANKYRVWLPRYLPLDNLNVQPYAFSKNKPNILYAKFRK